MVFCFMYRRLGSYVYPDACCPVCWFLLIGRGPLYAHAFRCLSHLVQPFFLVFACISSISPYLHMSPCAGPVFQSVSFYSHMFTMSQLCTYSFCVFLPPPASFNPWLSIPLWGFYIARTYVSAYPALFLLSVCCKQSYSASDNPQPGRRLQTSPNELADCL